MLPQQPPSPPARESGDRCELSEVRGRAPTAQWFSSISALGMASPDTIMLLVVQRLGGQDPVPLA